MEIDPILLNSDSYGFMWFSLGLCHVSPPLCSNFAEFEALFRQGIDKKFDRNWFLIPPRGAIRGEIPVDFPLFLVRVALSSDKSDSEQTQQYNQRWTCVFREYWGSWITE